MLKRLRGSQPHINEPVCVCGGFLFQVVASDARVNLLSFSFTLHLIDLGSRCEGMERIVFFFNRSFVQTKVGKKERSKRK